MNDMDHQQYVEWASPQLQRLGREIEQNEHLRELLRRWQLDVGGASEELERETIAAIKSHT